MFVDSGGGRSKNYQPDRSSSCQSSASLVKRRLATVRTTLGKAAEATGKNNGKQERNKGIMGHLCAGRPHCTARNLDVKATLGILFPPQGRVIVRLPTGLPVTNSFADGLEDAAVRGQRKKSMNCF